MKRFSALLMTFVIILTSLNLPGNVLTVRADEPVAVNIKYSNVDENNIVLDFWETNTESSSEITFPQSTDYNSIFSYFKRTLINATVNQGLEGINKTSDDKSILDYFDEMCSRIILADSFVVLKYEDRYGFQAGNGSTDDDDAVHTLKMLVFSEDEVTTYTLFFGYNSDNSFVTDTTDGTLVISKGEDYTDDSYRSYINEDSEFEITQQLGNKQLAEVLKIIYSRDNCATIVNRGIKDTNFNGIDCHYSIDTSDVQTPIVSVNSDLFSEDVLGTFTLGGLDIDNQSVTKVSNDAFNGILDYWNSIASNTTIVNSIKGSTADGFLWDVLRALAANIDTGTGGEEDIVSSPGETTTIPTKELWTEKTLYIDALAYLLKNATNGNAVESCDLTFRLGDMEDTADQAVVHVKKEADSTYTLSVKSGGNAPTALTQLQRAELEYVYTNLFKVRISNSDAQNKAKDFYKPDGDYTKEGEVTSSPLDPTKLRKDLDEFESYQYNASEGQIIDVARFSALLAEYVWYHATMSNLDSSEYQDEDDEFYNRNLDNMASVWGALATYEEKKEDDGDDLSETKTYAMVQMPATIGALDSGFGNLIDDSVNGKNGFEGIMSTLYGVSYAFEALVSSKFGQDQCYGYEFLGEYLANPNKDFSSDTNYANAAAFVNWIKECYNGPNATSQFNGEKLAQVELTDQQCVWAFRSIIQLHDLCEFLDIDPASWSTTINGYYQLYEKYTDFFDALRNNPYIMGLGLTGGNTKDNPLGLFFSVKSDETSEAWNIGFANSALYVPMVTNLYDASAYNMANTQDSTWAADFLYRFGFHRKALYISTDPNIVVNTRLSKASDNGRKVATLADLVNYDRDIQLYIDTDFYNAKNIENAIGKVDYATLYQYMHTEQTSVNITDEAALDQVKSNNSGSVNSIYKEDSKNFIDETLNLDTDTLLKNNDVLSYSSDVAKSVTKLNQTAKGNESLYDGYVLSADAITGEESIFSLYDYTPMLGYAVVSAIYRDEDMYNELASIHSSYKCVFESSRNVLFVDNLQDKHYLAYMNYLQLANLEAQMNKNVETQLDLNAPIFIDIFGDIVTESGYVIIPAAANATLCGENWTPYTIGFGSYLSAGGYDIVASELPTRMIEWLTNAKVSEESIDNEALAAEEQEAGTTDLDNLGDGSKGGWFVTTRKGNLQLKNTYIQSYGLIAAVNWGSLNEHSDVIQQVFWNNAYFVKARKMYGPRITNMIVEVLRGAPIENIDYNDERLNTVESSSAGIVIAYALDKLLESISTKSETFVNSLTTMPNLAFMPYLKYVVYFGIKITIALLVLLFLVRLFMNGVRNKLGIKEVFKFTFTVLVVVSAIYILPNSIIWSYDKANSYVLANEAEDILLYDMMRKSEGQEIGITDVYAIDENTELLVQVDTVTPNWADILSKGILSNEYTSFTDIFEDALTDTPYYGLAGVTQKGTNVYIDTQSIMNSTSISYSKSQNALYNKNVIRGNMKYTSAVVSNDSYRYEDTQTGNSDSVQGESGTLAQDYYGVYSFASPYYVILDQLIANVNEYNDTHDVQTYTPSINSKGQVQTYDVSIPYLMSDEFLEDGYDILGLTDILSCETLLPKYTYIFSENDRSKVKYSAWYPDDDLDEQAKQERIAEVYDYARSFVSEHKEVLKHIPDEMLLKSIAFATSIKYNQVFHVPCANSIKLITVDNRDMMRFMLGSFSDVYSNHAYTFGRYVYRTTGTVGVILSAILCVVILVTTVLKPVLIMLLFILIIMNICLRELILNKPNSGVEGYFIGCAIFMAINFLYAGLLKVCFMVSNSNLSAIASIVLCIVVQILYLLALLLMIWIQMSDWKTVGFTKFAAIGGMLGLTGFGLSKLRGNHNHVRRQPATNNSNAESVNVNVNAEVNEPVETYQADENTVRRRRGNRQSYDGNRTLDEMHARDEERENSLYRQ